MPGSSNKGMEWRDGGICVLILQIGRGGGGGEAALVLVLVFVLGWPDVG